MFSGGHTLRSAITEFRLCGALALRGGSCGRGSLSGNGLARAGAPEALHRDRAGSVLAPTYPTLFPRHCHTMQHRTSSHTSLARGSQCPPERENCLCTLLCPLCFTHSSCHSIHLAQAPGQQQIGRSEGPSLQAAPSPPRGCFPLPEPPAPSPVTLAHSHCGSCRSG